MMEMIGIAITLSNSVFVTALRCFQVDVGVG